MLLQNSEQQAILIDGGGLYSDRFDVGERLLAPALGELGVQRLTSVLLTHDHPDHRKGLIYVLDQFPVQEFWTGAPVEDLHPQLQQVLQKRAIPVHQFPGGWSSVEQWKRGEMQLFFSSEPKNKNDSSLVLYLQDGSEGVLLTGDLEKRGVGHLLAAGIPGPVTILKLPHHGSRHSNTDELIRTFMPSLCLVSAGFQNRYGFPAADLVTVLRQQEIPLYRTDSMGTIRVLKKADGWDVKRWDSGLFR